jgi:uncharacterized protein YjdB
LAVKAKYSDYTQVYLNNSEVTFTRAGSGSSTVSAGGTLTVGLGSNTFTATFNGKTSNALSVTSIVPVSGNPSKLEISKTTAALDLADATPTVQLSARILDGEDKPVSDTAKTALIWESNNNAVATVDNTGLVTAKNKGSATITARSVYNKSIYAYCWVTVTDTAADKQPFTITLNDGGDNIAGKAIVRDKGESFTLKAKDENVSWTSSDKAVATINSQGVVLIKDSGTTNLTAKVKNGPNKNKTAFVTLIVSDTKPKLPLTAITYYELAGKTGLTVWPTDNFVFATEGALKRYDGLKTVKKPGKNSDKTHELFKVSEVVSDTQFILEFIGEKPKNNKKYTLYLQTTKGGDADANLVGEPFPITVNYIKTMPITTAKMPPALNTFWQDASGRITITTGADQPQIVDVRLVQTGKAADKNVEENFKILKDSIETTPTGAVATVIAEPEFKSFTDKNNTKPAVKGILKVYFEGFGTTDAEKEAACAKINVTIPIKPVAPKLALSPATQTLNTKIGSEAVIAVTGGAIKPKGVSHVKGNAEVESNTEGAFKVALTEKGVKTKSNPLQFNVLLDGARTDTSAKPILIKPTIKTTTADPNYKLSAKTITFGKMDKEQQQVISIVPSASNVPVDFSAVGMLTSAKGVTVEAGAGFLTVTVPGGTDNGSYKFNIPAPNNKTLPLTVKVDKKPLAATVKAEKGNIDLMAREYTQLSYIPTIKNTHKTIKAGTSGVMFEAIAYSAKTQATAEDNIYRAREKLNVEMIGGKAVVTAKLDEHGDHVPIAKGEQFKVRFKFTLADDNTVTTGTITIKPAQSTVKHSIPKTATLYQSRTMSGHSHLASFNLTAAAPLGARVKTLGFKEETNANMNKTPKKYVNNPNNAYWYSFDASSQRLDVWLLDSALVKPGKATLTFSATYDGQGLERYKSVNDGWVEWLENGKKVGTKAKPIDIKIPVTVAR